MAPENINGTNMWRLGKDEKVVGANGSIEGPTTVRVTEFPEYELIQVQLGGQKLQVQGKNFSAVVTKK